MSGDAPTRQRTQAILQDLIQQRQRFRAEGVDRSLLEANRLGIVYWQRQLARAGRHSPGSDVAA